MHGLGVDACLLGVINGATRVLFRVLPTRKHPIHNFAPPEFAVGASLASATTTTVEEVVGRNARRTIVCPFGRGRLAT